MTRLKPLVTYPIRGRQKMQFAANVERCYLLIQEEQGMRDIWIPIPCSHYESPTITIAIAEDDE